MTTLDAIDPTDPVGNPGYYNASRPKGQVRVMFLGGPLDHAIRFVPCDPRHQDRPTSDVIFHAKPLPFNRPIGGAPEPVEMPKLTYRLHRVDTGMGAWFCYVLDGHEPSRSSLLDTNPFPI